MSARPLPLMVRREATRGLSMLLNARVGLMEAFDLLGRESGSRRLHAALERVSAEVARGIALAAALRSAPEWMDEGMAHLVGAGETAGRLPEVLERIADDLDRQAILRRQVVRVFAYPAVVMAVTAASLAVLLWWVIPMFDRLFVGNADLPVVSRWVFAASAVLRAHTAAVLLAILGGTAMATAFGVMPAARPLRERVLLALPLLGPLYRTAGVARFCRTLALLLGNGVHLLAALDWTARATAHRHLRRDLLAIHIAVSAGGRMSDAMRKGGRLPPLVIQVVCLGEAASELPALLQRLSTHYESELERRLVLLAAVAEPLLVVLVGLLVGGVLLAVYLPLFRLGSVIH